MGSFDARLAWWFVNRLAFGILLFVSFRIGLGRLERKPDPLGIWIDRQDFDFNLIPFAKRCLSP